MSENWQPPTSRADKRVLRTRDRLGGALIELIQEKPFDRITVREVVERAGVGRSTFYDHFQNTLDLFMSDADESLEEMAAMLSVTAEVSDRVAPVSELLEHVAENRPLARALLETGWLHQFLELAKGHLARGIARRLAEHPRRIDVDPIVAHGLAGTLISMMTFWLHHGMQAPPAVVDAAFHQVVWSGIGTDGRR